MKKALPLGILASLFFAFTFIFNRSMDLAGGYWIWSASLGYLFSLPILYLLVRRGGGLGVVLDQIRARPGQWLLWSTVGFGLFYLPLTMASVYGESWFVAATWQLTIVAGILLTPLFGKPIPVKNLLFSVVIISGVLLLQGAQFASLGGEGVVIVLALILLAAFSYPLGNRKMMSCCPPSMTTVQRVFGMTLCSTPFWLLCSGAAWVAHGPPSGGQAVQSLIVAIFSGVIATLLFFEATNLVRSDPKKLAVVEATQAGEVVFTLLGGILFLGDALPSPAGLAGIAIVIAGMVGNSLCSRGESPRPEPREEQD